MTTPQDPFSTPPGDRPTPTGGSGPGSGQPYGQPAGYGQPYGQPGAQGHRNGVGTAALVLGVIALLTSWIFGLGGALGLAAIILGVVGLRRVQRREASNRGSAIAGLVLGALSVLIAAFVVAGTVALFRSGTVQDLAECLQQAGQDPAAQEQCRREAEERLQR